uniref:C-type lectin domain-containing protein n=1 Tax=Astyanax mexicanus TaxID=7994 RepID=A0A8B9GSJ8_ASTMX
MTVVLVTGLLLPVLVVSSQQYPYISKKMSWMEAQKFCREMFSDLATVNTEEDMSGLLRIILAAVTQNVYIGLYRSGVFTWHWTLPGNGYLEFQNWKAGQPKVGSEQDGCAGMDQNGEWFEDSCSTQRTFVCTDDDLVLVRENSTWSEAVSYCREHHMDLVSVLSKWQQQSVERKASLASSSHVWLGLRYTCTFGFWFWTRDGEAGCYQNWATGQGTVGSKDCSMAGAMESSGEHQWVQRPQSERFNFICFTCVTCKTCAAALP